MTTNVTISQTILTADITQAAGPVVAVSVPAPLQIVVSLVGIQGPPGGAAPPSPWTPASLGSSLALWLDAQDAASITLNGSTVSQWSDKSGNLRHLSQGVAANQPTYLPVGFSGKPSLRTDGNDSLQIGATSLGRNVGGLTAAIVGMHPVGATFNANACDIIIYTANAGGTRLYLGPNPSASTQQVCNSWSPPRR
jgi:hypothetical protein